MSLTLGDYHIDLTVHGSGAQAKIVTGQHIVTKETVALKVFSLKTYSDVLCFENEARMLSQCRKIEQVVEARSCFVHKHFGFLVMPFYSIDLLSLVIEHSGLGEQYAARLFKQICEGLQQTHELRIAHLDIKPENILVDETGEKVFLCDFGNAYQLVEQERLVSLGRRGTLVYCAPEVKQDGNQAYDPIRADIWSLGILLHVMIAGYFPHAKNEQDMDLYHQGHVNLTFIRNSSSPQCFDLLTRLLVIAPEERISMEDLLAHPWVVMNTKKEVKTSIALKLSQKLGVSRRSKMKV